MRANSLGTFSVITDSTGLAFHVPEPGSALSPAQRLCTPFDLDLVNASLQPYPVRDLNDHLLFDVEANGPRRCH